MYYAGGKLEHTPNWGRQVCDVTLLVYCSYLPTSHPTHLLTPPTYFCMDYSDQYVKVRTEVFVV